MLNYLAWNQKWNNVYNLTAVRDPAEMLTHHVLDSLALIKPLRQHLLALRASNQALLIQPDAQLITVRAEPLRLLDVGAGAGLPGVVVAICCPDVLVDCVDAVAKKVAFIQQVSVTLKLNNLRGIHARVERLTQRYTLITSRAFASLLDFTKWSACALAEQGVWLAMKGKHPADELAALPANVQVFHVEQLEVPGLNAERCLVWMRR
jgi:16S rRNA (guanine527-N7)-methyltransferase